MSVVPEGVHPPVEQAKLPFSSLREYISRASCSLIEEEEVKKEAKLEMDEHPLLRHPSRLTNNTQHHVDIA